MNAVSRKTYNEVDVGTIEATDAKIDALHSSLGEVKGDVRELRADIHSLRDKVDKNHSEMHAGFTALRESIAGVQASTQTGIASLQASTQTSIASLQVSVAGLRATMKTMFWSVGAVGMLATIFFTAGRALHWF
jgi:peptidoglycan hydrolase CwlO-like protein